MKHYYTRGIDVSWSLLFSFFFSFAQHTENNCHVSSAGDFVFQAVSYHLHKCYHALGQEEEKGGGK